MGVTGVVAPWVVLVVSSMMFLLVLFCLTKVLLMTQEAGLEQDLVN